MPDTTFSETLLVLISTPLYAIVIGGEMIASHWENRHFYTMRDTLTNVYLMLLNMGLDLLTRGFTMIFLLGYLYGYRFFDWDLANAGWGLTIGYWALLFLAEDLAFYWLHRVDHSSRFFWAVHVTHHSSEQFNLTTGFRSSVFQPLYRFLYFIPLPLLGFQVEHIIFMYAATQIYGILVHTQYIDKMGFLEHILVTPSHHRVHHASNVLYLDKNLGMCLIFWDKLFGTFQAELPEEPVKYGLHSSDIERDPVNIVFHEWKKIYADAAQEKLPFFARLKYIFMPPGWSHDGSRKTAAQLRKELAQQQKQQPKTPQTIEETAPQITDNVV